MTKEELGNLIIASTDSLYRISKSILRNESDCEDAVSEAIVKSFDKIDTLQHTSYAKKSNLEERITVMTRYTLIKFNPPRKISTLY